MLDIPGGAGIAAGSGGGGIIPGGAGAAGNGGGGMTAGGGMAAGNGGGGGIVTGAAATGSVATWVSGAGVSVTTGCSST